MLRSVKFLNNESLQVPYAGTASQHSIFQGWDSKPGLGVALEEEDMVTAFQEVSRLRHKETKPSTWNFYIYGGYL